jgi:asparagine synthase (glutamine-hydrolysing)
MAGIFGAWNFDGRPMDPQVLGRMGRAMAHRGPDGESVFVRDAAGLGCRLFRVTPESSSEVQPLVRSSGAAVVFDGRLDNRADLIGALREHHAVTSLTPDPELVAACYETAGADFAVRLEGDFAAAVLDPASARLLLARDALGVRPLYYWTSAEAIVFASEIKAILAHPDVRARVNEPVLAEYFVSRLHRQPEDGTTFFQEIRSVPAAHVVMVASPGTVTARRYWDFNTRDPDGPRTFEAAADGFRHYFEQSVRRRLRSARPVAVAVSGGLDSSSIFCTAVALRHAQPADIPAIAGFTYAAAEGSPADERTFVEDIERFTGATIARIPLARGVLDHAEAGAWHGESPSADPLWNMTQRMFTAAANGGARVLLGGQWGDQVLFDQAYLVDLLRAGFWGTVAAHLHAYAAWHSGATVREFRRFFISDLLSHQVPPPMSRFVRRARKLLSRGVRIDKPYETRLIRQAPRREFRGDEPRGAATAHARSIYREVRSRYNVHGFEWHNKVASMFGLEPAFPFLDRDVIQFMMSVPGAVLNQDGVPKAILRRAEQGIVPARILERRSKADFTAAVNEGVRQDCAGAAPPVGANSVSVTRGFVNARTASAALAAAQRELDGDTFAGSSAITDLWALELWLDAYFEGDKA